MTRRCSLRSSPDLPHAGYDFTPAPSPAITEDQSVESVATALLRSPISCGRLVRRATAAFTPARIGRGVAVSPMARDRNAGEFLNRRSPVRIGPGLLNAPGPRLVVLVGKIGVNFFLVLLLEQVPE